MVADNNENTNKSDKADESSNSSSEKEDEEEDEDEAVSPRSHLSKRIMEARRNLQDSVKFLKTWYQFVLQNMLYNKEYVYMDAAFCWIEGKIFHTVIFLVIASILLHNFDPLLCATVGCFYPAYETTKALTTRNRRALKQREHWLIYWIVFSFITLQDYYTEWLTKTFPQLLLLKMLFLMLLALPQTGVAELCYDSFVVPALSVVNDGFTKYNVRQNSNVEQVTRNNPEAKESNE